MFAFTNTNNTKKIVLVILIGIIIFLSLGLPVLKKEPEPEREAGYTQPSTYGNHDFYNLFQDSTAEETITLQSEEPETQETQNEQIVIPSVNINDDVQDIYIDVIQQ